MSEHSAEGSQDFQEHHLSFAIRKLLQETDSLSFAFPITMTAIEAGSRDYLKKLGEVLVKILKGEKLNEFFEFMSSIESEEAKVKGFSFQIEDRVRNEEFIRSVRNFSASETAKSLVSNSFLFSLISQYDAFIGRIARFVILENPEILNGSDKILSFSKLLDFSSIEEAREHIIEKEVESVLRDSHSDHFRWLERRLNIKLTENHPSWPIFIEITERRNLLAHTGGKVSSQYLANCRAHNCQISEGIKLGDILSVDDSYFQSSVDCVYEISFKLCHVIWRKLRPNEREKADETLIADANHLISSGRYLLAAKLLDFYISGMNKKYSSERKRLEATIALAQAYKASGDQEKCRTIIGGQDWSASAPDLLIFTLVLQDNFSEAAKNMRKLGKIGNFSKTDYAELPIFSQFRETVHFRDAYKDIFEEDFTAASLVFSQGNFNSPPQIRIEQHDPEKELNNSPSQEAGGIATKGEKGNSAVPTRQRQKKTRGVRKMEGSADN
jgi:hypothetical protein